MMNSFLDGNRIGMREVRPEDIEGPLLYWNNDKEVTRFLYRGTFPPRIDELRSECARVAKSPNDVELMVIDKDRQPGKAIGVVGLYGIDWISRYAEFRILFGEKEYWGKGLGVEATMLICAYGFEVLNLHKIVLGVNSENVRARSSYERTGFVTEGQFRKEFYRAGRFYDVTRMGMLLEDYRAKLESWPIYEKLKEQYPIIKS